MLKLKDLTIKEGFDAHELAMGTKVEMEHTDDPAESERIAKEHLIEDPKYYSKLDAAGLADELQESKVGDYYIKIGETLEAMEKSYKKLNRLVSKMEFKDNSPEMTNLKKVENAIFDLKKIFGDSYDFKWSKTPAKSKFDVRKLIGTLDGISSFDKYYNPNASYDEPVYYEVPSELLSKYGFNEKILNKILDNTADYQGYISIDKKKNVVDIAYGGD